MHDILTGSTANGKVMAAKTCNDWTSDSKDQQAQIGHSDGLGPAAIPPADTPSGTHLTKTAAPATPPRAVAPEGFIVSRRDKPRNLRLRVAKLKELSFTVLANCRNISSCEPLNFSISAVYFATEERDVASMKLLHHPQQTFCQPPSEARWH